MADSSGLSVEQALSQPVEEMLPDEPKASSSSPSANGHASAAAAAITNSSPHEATEEDASTMDRDALLEELTRVKEERDGFEGSYKGLLGKLTQMRSTLGDRLRQDAVSICLEKGWWCV